MTFTLPRYRPHDLRTLPASELIALFTHSD